MESHMIKAFILYSLSKYVHVFRAQLHSISNSDKLSKLLKMPVNFLWIFKRVLSEIYFK